MRTNSDTLEIFKSIAESRGLSQVEYFEKMIRDSSQGKTVEILSKRLEEMNLKLNEKNSIIEQLEKKHGIKIKGVVTRKVTFIVTQEQFNQITSMAHKLEIPKNQLMSKFFLSKSKNHTPILENKNIE